MKLKQLKEALDYTCASVGIYENKSARPVKEYEQDKFDEFIEDTTFNDREVKSIEILGDYATDSEEYVEPRINIVLNDPKDYLMTNREWLSRMTDEELADWLRKDCKSYSFDKDFVDWLKEEHE